MPPKKGKAKANTPAKAAAAPAEPPATVTTAKGKDIPTTAAAGRSRRATTAVTETPSKKAPAKKAASKPATTSTTAATTTTKKRGRPAKAAEDDVTETEPPKKRGRPSKSESATPAPDAAAAKKRGRPGKGDAPAVPLEEKAPPKKRGRPKGGETTRVEAEDEAAAEQLEEELVDAAVNEPAEEPRKRISSVKKGKGAKGRGKKAATNDVEEEADADEGVEVTGKQYWLMKAEQEDREETLKDGSVFNAKFTIDDLRDKGDPEPWDGVRNPTACKNMREMKLGDLAFFYASGGKKGRVPGITGIMEIVREHEPDPSALDENSPFYVENQKMRGTAEKPRWSMVHVEFRKKLSEPVTLTELKKYAEKDSVLSQMQELNAARLSVSKVSEKEWDFIVNELIEGYEDDEAPLPTTTVNGIKDDEDPYFTEAPKGLDPAGTWRKPPIGLPDDFVLVKETIETDVPTTDTVLAVETAATSSRPGSRAGSKKPSSRAASRTGSRPGSRAGSLAPPKATSRGRSRTPRRATPQPMTVVAEEMEVVME